MARQFLSRLRMIFEIGSHSARWRGMEGLRGFAVFLVFLQHFSTQMIALGKGSTIGVRPMANYGNYGVELFFVLSGFLIYGTLIKGRVTGPQFMRRRMQRIYPAFFVAFLITIMARSVGAPQDVLPGSLSVKVMTLGENLVFLPGLFPIHPIMTVAWSLSYEMFFYLAIAAAVFGLSLPVRSRDRRLKLLYVLIGGFCAVAAYDPAAVPIRMLPFFAGMLLAEEIGKIGKPAQAWGGLLGLVLAFLVTSVFIPMPPILRETLHTVVFFCLVSACLDETNVAAKLFSWTPLRWLGNISYSYYLVHAIAVVSIARIFKDEIAFASPLTVWLLAIPFFLASLIPALGLFLLVERPLSLPSGKPIRGGESMDVLRARGAIGEDVPG